MTKQIPVASGFRTERQTRHETLRGATTAKRSTRGILLGVTTCLIVAGTALYEIIGRLA